MNYCNLFSPRKVINAIRIEARAIQQISLNGNPDIQLYFLGGFGDEVMLTCLAHELKKRNPHIKIWQISSAAELIRDNPDYSLVLGRNYNDLCHSNLLKKKN